MDGVWNMHVSVLLKEAIDSLNLQEDSIIIDATLGYGGHSSEILKRIKRGYLFAFDQDSEAISFSEERLSNISRHYKIIKSNFVFMKRELDQLNVHEVDGVLFDLGVSSPQLDDGSRGFSFHQDAPLDMRMDKENPLSAYEVVNGYEEKELARIFFQYGEDKFARQIAHNIVAHRPITSTLELVEVIKEAVPFKAKREKHPARQIFQAIRIEVNHELDILESSLKDALSLLRVGGRVSVITFHSLEDRIVKRVFKEMTEVDSVVKGLPQVPDEYLPNYRLVTNKAILPSDEELKVNNRSRSAKLRVIERIK